MNTKIILLFILSLIFLISCQANNYILDNSTSNVTKVEIKKCGIQECHGPDFSCGTEVREVCTLEYRLGDRCYEFVKCLIKDNSCQMEKNPKYEACKNCVYECMRNDKSQDPIACEDSCLTNLSISSKEYE